MVDLYVTPQEKRGKFKVHQVRSISSSSTATIYAFPKSAGFAAAAEAMIEDVPLSKQETPEKAPPEYGKLILTPAGWAKRKMSPKDHLLGEVFSTTTRAILSAETGIGKTHLGFDAGLNMAAGKNFCHWKAKRKARVLVIDGEMSAELVQERLADAVRRLGESPDNFFCLCREDVDDMPPLDTEAGQAWIDGLLEYLKPIDFVIFDNLMSLTVSDLRDEEGWKAIIPWNRSLTKRRIGTLWINHTGHNKERDYGTSTRLWQMDTAIVLTKIKDHSADIAFRLEFVKARQRKPSNRADYEPVKLILENDAWRTMGAPVTPKATTSKPGCFDKAIGFLDNLLVDATSIRPTANHVSVKAVSLDKWRDTLATKGVLSRDNKGNIDGKSRELFRRIKAYGVDCDAVGIHDDWIWRI